MAGSASPGRSTPPAVVVVFGASGDLTNRKVLPALAGLARDNLLDPATALVGVARTQLDDADFAARVKRAGPEAGPAWARLAAGARYVAGDDGDPDTFQRLGAVLDELDRTVGTSGNRLFYLATVPTVFPRIVAALGTAGPGVVAGGRGFTRIVIEKPFGHDLASAEKLDEVIHDHFDETQIYRIDHYLGKETVQNLLALRFANAIFEPIWNRRYVDHVQITVAEELGVEERAGFYESAGALRDIVQNHLLQVLALTCMEPPVHVDAKGIRDEKVKVIEAIEPMDPGRVAQDVVRAQYRSGTSGGHPVPGYREERGVAPDSQTETFVAARLSIDNWRWNGVPFYIRTGKRLGARLTEVAMQFRRVPHLPFAAGDARGLHPNSLVLRIQPDEGICLEFGAKVPGQGFTVRSVNMDFSYAASFAEQPHDGYERLLLDALTGDPTLFIRSDEAASAWRICDPILSAWADGAGSVVGYPAGSWGPREADRLLERDGRRWRHQ